MEEKLNVNLEDNVGISGVGQRVLDKLDELTLCHGVGNSAKHTACTIAAINLAETGVLTDDRPECVSKVIHRWVMPVQDQVSVETLNSSVWRALVPRIAGTAGADPQILRTVLLEAMWVPLGWVQPVADRHGFGAEWARMLEVRTAEACRQARAAAASAAADAAAYAAYAAAVAANAAEAATVAAAYAAAYAAATNAAYAAAYAAAAGVAWAAADAAEAAEAAPAHAAYAYGYAATYGAAAAKFDDWAVRTLTAALEAVGA